MENTEELKDLQLESADFDLLIEALEHLPNKGVVGKLMVDIFSLVTARNEEERNKIEIERKIKEEKVAQEVQRENIKILQVKLIRLKRFLICTS